ncbi:MAG: chemotaxis response regulator protein-glutamate methylesterase [Rickettsiales bacterium]|jgi:two-component system chemotaxis response regulator CheB
MLIKVLLVDDSAVIRGLMSKALSVDSSIEIVGTAGSGVMAIAMAKDMLPNVIILDIEMPGMDGLAALPELLKISPNSKIIMASALTKYNASVSLEALALGAADYIAKPSSRSGDEVNVFYRDLIEKIKALAGKVVTPPASATAKSTAPVKLPHVVQLVPTASIPLHVTGVKALAIASSTGGPQALMVLFQSLKGRLLDIPIFITQHMPPTFTTILAEHLTKVSARNCIEVKGGEVAVAGNIYLAPGDFHMLVEKDKDGKAVIRITKDPQENFCRPAADPMFRSLSKIYGRNLAVVVLTGMGQDGMLGAKVVVENGGSVVAQDEASCVVYGMPKAVVENKLCRAVLPLLEIGKYLTQQIEGR